MNIKDALDKGYLEDRIVTIKPVPRGASMGIKDPKHVAFFQHDGCSTYFTVPNSTRGGLINVFKDEEERLFFENQLGRDLNPLKPGNYFETLSVQVTKDAVLMSRGIDFDMSDPMDNIRAKVVMSNSDRVSPSWEKRYSKNTYRWAVIDKTKADEEASSELDSTIEFGMAISKFASSEEDMRVLLKIYLGSTNSNKKITKDTSKQALKKELNDIAGEKDSRVAMIKLIEDPSFYIKKMMIKAIEFELIKREGLSAYIVVGEDQTYNFNELSRKLSDAKNNDDEFYFKLQAQIEQLND